MAHKMSDIEIHEFLTQGTRTGKLATVRADGRPHVVPIWFVADGDDLVFMTGADTLKGRNLRRDPRAALVVDLEEAPYGFVLAEGTVSLSDDLEAMLPLSIAIAARYMPAEQAEEFGRRNAVEGELLCRLTAPSYVALGDMTG